jgi:hypothetical protein
MPKATRSGGTRPMACAGHSLHFGLSAPPTASQASVPGGGPANPKHALIAQPSASKPRPKLFHLTYRYIFESSFLPLCLGRPKASGDHSQGERLLYGRDPRGLGGTGKAEAAKCAVCIPATGLRAWEFSRSCAQARGGKGEKYTASVHSVDAQARRRTAWTARLSVGRHSGW